VAVECAQAPAPVLGLVLDTSSAALTIQVPSERATLRIDVTDAGRVPSRRYDVCSLATAPGAPVVQFAVGTGARGTLEEGVVSGALEAVARRAAGDGTGAYASAAALGQTFADAVVPLASPSDTPGDRRVGVFSDEGRTLAVVARALTGRRLYAEFSGPVLRTNLLSVNDLLP
jgi:hypothetical protein